MSIAELLIEGKFIKSFSLVFRNKSNNFFLFSFHSAKYGSAVEGTQNITGKSNDQKKAKYCHNLDHEYNNIECKFVVSSLNSLWVCQHAMNPKHECTYCMCNKCYMQKSDKIKDGSRTTRGRRNKMKSVDDSNKQCDSNKSMKKCSSDAHHLHNLNQFVDSLYFSSAYKAKIEHTSLYHLFVRFASMYL